MDLKVQNTKGKEIGMSKGLTVFAHLSARDTDEVVVGLVHEGRWGGGMVYDSDSSLLMTTTDHAKDVVTNALEKRDLLPEGETRLFSNPQLT